MCYDGSCIGGKLEKKITSGPEVSAAVLTGMHRGTLEFCNTFDAVRASALVIGYICRAALVAS